MVEVFKGTPIRRMTTGGNYVNLTADVVLLSDYEALRAELEQVKRERGLERLRDYGLTLEPNVVICDRRVVDEAAAHIGALEAENARLLGALIEIECRPEKMIWGGSTEVLGAMRDMEDIARRAREGGNADG